MPTQAQHTAVWTETGIIVLGLVTEQTVGLWRTYDAWLHNLSVAAMKLALPGPSIHLLLLSSFAALEEKTLSFSAALYIPHTGLARAASWCSDRVFPV